MIEAAFTQLMPTTATYQNVSSLDIYGKRTGGPVVTFKCHIKTNRIESHTAEDRVVSMSGTVYMDNVYDVTKNAILTLPDGLKPKITNVLTSYNENGPHHTTIDFEG
jgi:hypothetical protein